MNEVYFQILQTAAVIAAALIARYLIPFLKDKIGETNLEAAKSWAETFVRFAQQTMQRASGEEKKAYVTDALEKLFADKNITITREQLDALIEAAVKTMHMEDPERLAEKSGGNLE